MTRCLARQLLVLLTVAWSLTAMVHAEQAKPKNSVEPAKPNAAAAPAKPKTAAEPAKSKAVEPAKPKAAEAAPPKAAAGSTMPKSSAGASTSPSNTYTVKTSPLRITLELDGVFESRKTHEVIVKPEEWMSLTVLDAVPHGRRVKEGEVLLRLDTKKLDQAISELQAEQKLNELARQLATDQLSTLERMVPMDMEASKRAAQIAEEDRADYFAVERPFLLKAGEHRLKDSKDSVDYQAEELRQLEKMYKADDITEETEKIVLKRARDALEREKFWGLENTQRRHDETLKYLIPRLDTQIKEYAQRKAVDWERDKAQFPLMLQKQRLELERLKTQHNRSAERLTKLLADQKLMVVKSPIDGVLYYGKSVRGKFGDSNNAAESLRRHSNIQANQVLMTIVQPEDLYIRATVPEEQLHNVHAGVKGVATPAGYPETHLAVKANRVGEFPIAPDSYDARFELAGDEPDTSLVPGMMCKIRLTAYFKKDALCVPSKALVPDELHDQEYCVWRLKSDGTNEKVSVVVGKRTDKKVEILQGLNANDRVLLEAPQD
jgi:multidrug efflux pump subunit AcrA (membrane-fusion protein)